MKKEKYYLSLPITGRNLKDVKVYARRVKKIWIEKGYDVVTPFEVTDQSGNQKDEWGHYANCMGRCVETLLMCDGIIMCADWFSSRGCRLEYNVAEIYKKKITIDSTQYIGRRESGKENQV